MKCPRDAQTSGEKTEIGETAVCNLSSLNLKTHLKKGGKLDFKLLAKTIATQMRMLDNVIELSKFKDTRFITSSIETFIKTDTLPIWLLPISTDYKKIYASENEIIIFWSSNLLKLAEPDGCIRLGFKLNE